MQEKNSAEDVQIIYSTSFLSFSTDNKIAKGLGSRRLETSKNRPVIIKLNPLNREDSERIIKTNGNLCEISYYHDESEILFFPFSSFELVDVREFINGMVIIEFNYSLRFRSKVDESV